MKKLIHTSYIVLLVSQFAWMQANASQGPATPRGATSNSGSLVKKHYANLTIQAEQLNAAVISGDYAKAADLTYFKLVELLGGRASYIAVIEKGMKQLQSDASRVLSDSVGEPLEVFEVKNQLYAILPTTMEIKVPEGLLVGKAFMIGVSKDGGENWTFLAVSRKFEPQELKILFPAAADKIHVPEIKPPVLQRETQPS
jgi:hypothetical protein